MRTIAAQFPNSKTVCVRHLTAEVECFRQPQLGKLPEDNVQLQSLNFRMLSQFE